MRPYYSLQICSSTLTPAQYDLYWMCVPSLFATPFLFECSFCLVRLGTLAPPRLEDFIWQNPKVSLLVTIVSDSCEWRTLLTSRQYWIAQA